MRQDGHLVGEGEETGEVVAELLLLVGLRRKYSFAALKRRIESLAQKDHNNLGSML
jgi:hypothetical protein